ncbi:hypothetical protein [Flavobacterium sp. JP2137]|uniref:hypothetical protein n=1 Tax=Flavobacterium sp. JP2137 TaxID=3414510 RepID=UPI003D2FDD03
MRNKGDFINDGIAVIETLPNAGTELSAVFEESGQLKKKTIGSISMLPKESYLPGLSLAFPSIFNLNTTSLDYAHTDMTVSLASQLKGAVLMAPISMNGTPAFRKIVRSDLDLSEVVFEDAPIFGNFVKKSGDTMVSTSATPLVIERTTSTGNSGIGFRTTLGIVHAGNADGTSFAVGPDGNLASVANRWLSVSATGVSTRPQGGNNLQSRDIGGFYIDTAITNSRAEHIVRHKFTNRNVTFALGGVSGSTGSMSQWGMFRFLNDRTVNGSDGFFGFMGDSDTVGASSLAGVGDRMMIAKANGSFSSMPLPTSQIQRLDLNDTTGYIGISNSNSVRLHSLVTINKPDANISPISGGGLSVYSNTTGSINYPNALGGGLSYNRLQNTFVGGIDIWTSSNVDSKVYIRAGKSATEYHPFEIIATEPWVKSATYNNNNLRAMGVPQPYDPNNNPQIYAGGHISNYGTSAWLTGGILNGYGGVIAFRMAGATNSGVEFNYEIGRNKANGGRLAFRGVAGSTDTVDGANGGYKPWKEVWSSGDFTEIDVSNWRASFLWGNHAGLYHSLSFNTPGVAVSYTGSLLAMPVGSYSAVISTSATNRPFVNTGGLISFGQLSAVTTRILGARDNSDNLWFQSGDGTGDWRQLATREYVLGLGYSTQTLTAGTNIQIVGNVISSTNTTYAAGTLAQLNAGTVTTNYIWSPKIISDFVISKIPQVTQIFEKTIQGGLRVMDWDSIANRPESIAIGLTASATKIGALAMMTGATADGNDSIAIGAYSQVLKTRGVNVGPYNTINVSEGNAYGTGLIVNQKGCTVLGKYNNPILQQPTEDIDIKSPALIVGRGKSNNIRSNAWELYSDGSSRNFGPINYDGNSIIDFSDDLTVPHIRWIRANISGGGGDISDDVALSGTDEVLLNPGTQDFEDRVINNGRAYGTIWTEQEIGLGDYGDLVEFIAEYQKWYKVDPNSETQTIGALLGIVIDSTSVLIEGYIVPEPDSFLDLMVMGSVKDKSPYFGTMPNSNMNLDFYDKLNLPLARTCGMILHMNNTKTLHFNPGLYGRI